MIIPSSDADLLAECEVETYRSSGPGGQNVNARDTAVRLRHLPSGMVVTCQDERSQFRNKQLALRELRERLEEMRRPKTRRVRTAVPGRVRSMISQQKKRRSLKKALRRRPRSTD